VHFFYNSRSIFTKQKNTKEKIRSWGIGWTPNHSIYKHRNWLDLWFLWFVKKNGYTVDYCIATDLAWGTRNWSRARTISDVSSVSKDLVRTKLWSKLLFPCCWPYFDHQASSRLRERSPRLASDCGTTNVRPIRGRARTLDSRDQHFGRSQAFDFSVHAP
jgi:hypothetical protein